MDREQEEMQFLGLSGIYTESFKIILTWRKIFSQITLALILPLSFTFLIHMEVSHILLSKIGRTEFEMDQTRSDTTRFHKLANLVTKEWILFLLFKVLYFTFLLIFSLLSTAAVVYTIASIYTSRDVSFRKVISVVPRVWKRLMVTFVCMFVAMMVYNIVALVILVICVILFAPPGLDVAGNIVVTIVLIIYAIGFVYLTILWQLASVVSVLEESYGLSAMKKSIALLRGKIWVAVVIFFKLNVALVLIEVVFESFVVHGELGMMSRVGYGALCFLLLFMLVLLGLVVQTVIYFVCKSYHHENIDKSALSDHLEVYLGEYVPLKSKDVQLEEYSV